MASMFCFRRLAHCICTSLWPKNIGGGRSTQSRVNAGISMV